MDSRKQELEDFKSLIPLDEYAMSCGYVLDRKSSSDNCRAFKNASREKILITKRNGIWFYSPAKNELKGRTIIDFVKEREGCFSWPCTQDTPPVAARWIIKTPKIHKRKKKSFFPK